MKADTKLRNDVIDELTFDPMIVAADIGVTAQGGGVTLTGTVTRYPQKYTADDAAERVGGVRGIAEELHVELSTI